MTTAVVGDKKPMLSNALSILLPTEEQTWLLRACLYRGESGRQAWRIWQEQAGDSKEALTQSNHSFKRLLPLLYSALQRNGATVHASLLSYLRTAYVREELRSHIYRRVCQETLTIMISRDIPVIVLKGAALASTIYGDWTLRHCHDIDVLLRVEDLSRATNTLRTSGFTCSQVRAQATACGASLVHQSHLPLQLHVSLFNIPYYNVPAPGLWNRSQRHIIAEKQFRILSPADALFHVCGHASYSSSRESLRWICDAWYIIDRRPELDWDTLLECVRHSHLALPLSVMLGYLSRDLNATIPVFVREHLTHEATRVNSLSREAALFGAQSGTRRSMCGTLKHLFQRESGWRARAFILKWLLFPSPLYLRCVRPISFSWPLPFFYLYRLLRYVASRIQFFFRRLRNIP